MDFKLSQTRLQVFSISIKALSVAVVMSLCLNIILSAYVMRDHRHQSIVLIPAGMSKQATLKENSVSESYLESLATMVVSERLNVTPESVSGSNENLLHYVDPSYYASFKKKLESEEGVIKQGKISSAFYPNRLVANTHSMTVVIQGRLKQWVGLRPIAEKTRVYKVTFSRNGYLLLLKSFKELEKKP